jgi:hypothetical protein
MVAFADATAQEKNTAPEATSPGPGETESSEEAIEVRIGGYLQLWWTIKEETENGKFQPLTGDKAAQEASGFSFRRARLSTNISRERFRAKLELALEGSPRLTDAYGVWSAIDRKLEVWAGQMKIPGTHEVETPSTELDFATRSAFSAHVSNWSLCRSPTVSSPLYGIRTYLRDTGLGIKGEIGGGKYFLMAGNGLGANLWVGGAENKQFIYANSFGAYFYGARISYDLAQVLGQKKKEPLFPSLAVGGHYCMNRHPELIFRDEKTVMDIDRESWSLDLKVNIMNRVKLTGMVGKGLVLDDFDNDDKIDYLYSGWELKAVVIVVPESLELGFRYDTYSEEYFENGAVEKLDSYTFGITYNVKPNIRLQLNYKWKTFHSKINPDLKDDVFLLVAQFLF